MHEATSDDLQLITENMQKYTGGPATLRKMLHMLQDEIDKCSNTTCPDAMEARVGFQ